MIQLLLIFCISLMFNSHVIIGYGLPALGLGTSNFLDGGPLRPRPGFYYQQNTRYYHADIFRDANGETINKDDAVDFNSFATVTQLAYQFRSNLIPKSQISLIVALPFVIYNHINCNPLGSISSGSGLGDLAAGLYVQFDPILADERPVFVHRLELDAVFPTGKNEAPLKNINPGNNIFYIVPSWNFTLYMTPDFATSWSISYLWADENKKTGLRPGQTVYLNYTLEARALPKLWVGINGYYLEQLKNNKLCGVEVPHSKEQVVATGFGALYTMTKKDNLFFNLYFECCAKNRPQGMSFFFRYLKKI